MPELNLLPPLRRHQLAWRLVTRSITGLLVTLLASLFCLTLIGGGLLVWFRSTAARSMSAELTQTVEAYQSLRTELSERNTQLRSLVKIDDERIRWSPLLAQLLAVVPSGVQLDRLTIQSDSRRLTLGGVAPNRANLIVLERQLQALPWAESVTAPASNLLQRENVSFSFEILVRSFAGRSRGS